MLINSKIYAMNEKPHVSYLLKALELAQKRRGFCAPNPAVGAVVVKNGKIIGEGYHWAVGYPHAEVEALKSLSESARGADLYVTLEPCCHHGRTPPCTDLIIEQGLKAVYYGFRDPNPVVSGRGEALLKAANIDCQYISIDEINAFYRSYNYWTQHHRPWITAKIALSQDHKIAGPEGKPVNITGPELQLFTHQQRYCSDAILTTINTVLADDPQLNVRINNAIFTKPIFVLDSQLRFPLKAKLYETAEKLTIFHASTADKKQREKLEALGVTCIEMPNDSQGLQCVEIFNYLGHQGFHDVWVEAGGKLFRYLYGKSLMNQAIVYLSSRVLGEKACPAVIHLEQLAKNAKIKRSFFKAQDQVFEFLL